MLNGANGSVFDGFIVISQNRVSKLWGIAINVVRNAVASKHIQPQIRFKLEGQQRASIGFDAGYVKEVDRVLPARDKKGNRGKKGKTVFTDDIIEKLKPINKKWPTKED